MSNPRKKHVGKSKAEKELYSRMLKTQQREDPTYDQYDSDSTNSIVKQETGKSSITEPTLKPYQKEMSIQWKEILYALIAFGITTVLFLFGMSLNREIGVLTERSERAAKELDDLSVEIKAVERKLDDLNVELRILQNTKFDTNKK